MQTLINIPEHSPSILHRQLHHHVYATVPVRHLQAWMFHASVAAGIRYYTHCKLFVILICKYCIINRIPFGDSLCNMLYVNKAQWHARRGNTMNGRFMLERNKIMWRSRWSILVRNKKLWTIVFGNWNKTRTNSFLEMGMSSSNIPNVFKGSTLTGHPWILRIARGYLLNSLIFSYSLHIFKDFERK